MKTRYARLVAAGLIVRHADEATDLQWLAAHDGHLGEAALRRKIRDGEVVVAVRAQGELVGLLRLDHLWSVLPHIAQVRVLEPHRRQGVGRALVAFVEAETRRNGGRKLLSSTRPDYTGPQEWHRRIGFTECGSLAGFGPSGEPVMFFLKEL